MSNSPTVDHYFPLMTNKLPTGYITELSNLIPCCGSCNSSKGGKHWKSWYLYKGTHDKIISSGVTEEKYKQRLETLGTYEKSGKIKLDYEKLLE